MKAIQCLFLIFIVHFAGLLWDTVSLNVEGTYPPRISQKRLQQNVNEGEEQEQPVDKPATLRVKALMKGDHPVSSEGISRWITCTRITFS